MDGYHLRAEFVRNSATFIDQVFSKVSEFDQHTG
jgi:hypothetical protein